jgi:hypothetical protein
MSRPFLLLLQLKQGEEDVMSPVKRKIVEIEKSTSEKESGSRKSPSVVPIRGMRLVDQVAERVAEVVDFELAQGSMPT